MLPTEHEMDELDGLFEQASSILIRWRLKMTLEERTAFPTTFNSIDEAEKALMRVSDALSTISQELGFSHLRPEAGVTPAVPPAFVEIIHSGTTRFAGGQIVSYEEFIEENKRAVIKASATPVKEHLAPETLGDWIDLGISIKEGDPNLSGEVNSALSRIHEETPDADEDKRWLMSKAKELGIPITWGLDYL